MKRFIWVNACSFNSSTLNLSIFQLSKIFEYIIKLLLFSLICNPGHQFNHLLNGCLKEPPHDQLVLFSAVATTYVLVEK